MENINMINVVWLSFKEDIPSQGYWDHGLLEDLLTSRLWKPVGGFDFEHYRNSKEFHNARGPLRPGSIVVFPARSQADKIDELNEFIKDLPWVILMLTGDEEAVFPIEKVVHENIRFYVMSPRPGRHDKEICGYKPRFLGTGYPPQIHGAISQNIPIKDNDWFFAGQITHDRRKECAKQLEKLIDEKNNGILIETKGFTQGVEPRTYYSHMLVSKVAPAPSGPETPDSFRLFEALETACIPIADTRVTKGDFPDNYWEFFFNGPVPFPVLKDYEQLPGYIDDQVKVFPVNNNNVFAWWICKKRELAYQLMEDIRAIAHKSVFKLEDTLDGITVIIPTSPIKSHPNIKIIDETINSIRHHLPDSEIIITFDGVRPEQEGLRSNYNEFIRRVLWKCNTEYKNVVPLIFDRHMHQTGMAREALNHVKTKLILYVEQDTPLVTDYDINFESLMDPLFKGVSNVIRLHHEAIIPKEHFHMIHGMEKHKNLDLMRTSQWSQRPHLSTVAFYKRILSENFSPNAKSFIEDLMHGIIAEAYVVDGIMGWHQYKLHIYIPDEKNIKRSYHTDGREGAEKYDNTQVF